MADRPVLSAIASLWRRPPPIADPAALRSFVEAESAFLTQRTVMEYARARAGLSWQRLLKDADFQAAFDHARWTSFPAVLADMLLVTEGYLRPHAPAKLALADSLVRLLEAILFAYPASSDRQEAWRRACASFAVRLARAQLGPPRNPATVAREGGALLFDALPIHPSLRKRDREVVVNAVRFGMLAYWQKLQDRVVDPALLAQRLVEEQATATDR